MNTNTNIWPGIREYKYEYMSHCCSKSRLIQEPVIRVGLSRALAIFWGTGEDRGVQEPGSWVDKILKVWYLILTYYLPPES